MRPTRFCYRKAHILWSHWCCIHLHCGCAFRNSLSQLNQMFGKCVQTVNILCWQRQHKFASKQLSHELFVKPDSLKPMLFQIFDFWTMLFTTFYGRSLGFLNSEVTLHAVKHHDHIFLRVFSWVAFSIFYKWTMFFKSSFSEQSCLIHVFIDAVLYLEQKWDIIIIAHHLESVQTG